MRYYIAFIASLFILSCTEDKPTVELPVDLEPVDPVFIVSDYDSITITSIESIRCDYNQPDLYCSWFPNPNYVRYSFDVDQDSISDLALMVSHSYYWQSPSTNGYDVSVNITSENENYFVATDSLSRYKGMQKLNPGDVINNDLSWTGFCRIRSTFTEAGLAVINRGLCIVGIKRTINSTDNFGWVLINTSLFKAERDFTFFDDVHIYPPEADPYVLLDAVNRLYPNYPAVTLLKSYFNTVDNMGTTIIEE